MEENKCTLPHPQQDGILNTLLCMSQHLQQVSLAGSGFKDTLQVLALVYSTHQAFKHIMALRFPFPHHVLWLPGVTISYDGTKLYNAHFLGNDPRSNIPSQKVRSRIWETV